MSFKSQESLPNTVLMEEAGLKSLILCTLDHKNTFNKIFGGFIMRKAVLGIRIRRIPMFSGLPNPDPLVRGTGLDPDPDTSPDPPLFS
jgi:hypothetical protein